MTHRFAKLFTVLLVVISATGLVQAQGSGDPLVQGRSLSSWISSIRERDGDMDEAFQAIKAMGPEAAAAVPELTSILTEPFVAIRIGVDDDDEIAQKMYDLQLRSDAVDSLGAIGSAAAPATAPLIGWALTKRVVPESIQTEHDYKAFVDLVSLDALERMRVVGVVSGFRLEAAPAILLLINSRNTDERKLAVAILRGHVLPIAAGLLKSDDCRDRKLGAALLVDLWSEVPTDHLIEMKMAVECSSDPE